MREATHWGNVLFSDIGDGGSIVLGSSSFTLSDSVDFLVDLSSVEETLLTSSGNSPGNTGWMPSSNTSDFSPTSVRFLLEVAGSPSLHDTGETFTLGDTNDINGLVLSEDLIDLDFLFEVLEAEVNLGSNILSTVDLDFEDIVSLLSEVFHQVHLSVGDDSHDSAVLFDSVELSLGLLGVLGNFSLIVGEGFLL